MLQFTNVICVFGSVPPSLTWHIYQTIVDCLFLVVTTHVFAS